MDVVAAPVHRVVARGPLDTGLLDQWQRVQLGADRHRRSRRTHANHEPSVGDPRVSQVGQRMAQPLDGRTLVAADIGVPMEFTTQELGVRQVRDEVLVELGKQSDCRITWPIGHPLILAGARVK